MGTGSRQASAWREVAQLGSESQTCIQPGAEADLGDKIVADGEVNAGDQKLNSDTYIRLSSGEKEDAVVQIKNNKISQAESSGRFSTDGPQL